MARACLLPCLVCVWLASGCLLFSLAGRLFLSCLMGQQKVDCGNTRPFTRADSSRHVPIMTISVFRAMVVLPCLGHVLKPAEARWWFTACCSVCAGAAGSGASACSQCDFNLCQSCREAAGTSASATFSRSLETNQGAKPTVPLAGPLGIFQGLISGRFGAHVAQLAGQLGYQTSFLHLILLSRP